MSPTPGQAPACNLFLPCAAGIEALLADEVKGIVERSSGQVRAARGGVFVDGTTLAAAAALNLHSRLAQRVLLCVASGGYRSEDDLYRLACTVPWTAWITPAQTLKVSVTAQRSPLKSLHFVGLRVKDAVCDIVRDATGERPSVDTRRPHLSLLLHVEAEYATLYVDTSGEPLFKRGWRDDKGEAPLKETLAAALLHAAGWRGRAEDGPLLDPCCGAGTIAIEAAQMSCGIAPGLSRGFAFEHLAPFAGVLAEWKRMRQEARDAVHAPAVRVFASDVSFRMTDYARRNAQRAGVGEAIEIGTVDALQRMPPEPAGTMIVNPPYGERIEAKGTGQGAAARPGGRESAVAADGASVEFFSALASHWKRNYTDWTAWVLSPDMQLPRAMRLKETARVPMWNGPIECRLFRFELIAGSLRERTASAPE